MASKTYKLDIFKVIDRITSKDWGYWDTLTEEEQKALEPWVIQQWLSGVNDGLQVFLINEIVNSSVKDLGAHKELLYKLMCCSTTSKKRCKWMKKKPMSNYPKALNVLCEYLGESKRICKDYFSSYTNAELITISEYLGYQKDEVAAVKKELKKRDETV